MPERAHLDRHTDLMHSNIAVLVGSLRTKSINLLLARELTRLAPSGLSLRIADIAVLPHYNEDDEVAPAPSVLRFRQAISEAAGVIFVTPEYNRSVPGVLKNAIDQGSRPKGASVWAGKPAGVIGASPGALGSCMAQQHLRNVLAAVDMPTMGQPEAYMQLQTADFDDSGQLASDAKAQFVRHWIARFDAWQRHLRGSLAA